MYKKSRFDFAKEHIIDAGKLFKNDDSETLEFVQKNSHQDIVTIYDKK